MTLNHREYAPSLHTIRKELEWLKQVIEFRFNNYFTSEEDLSIDQVKPSSLEEDKSLYAELIQENAFNLDERVILLMALAVHVSPSIYDIFFARNTNLDRGFTVFGGVTNDSHNGFLPTGDTVAFVLCGRDLVKRFELLDYFSDDHVFHKKNILKLSGVKDDQPLFNGSLSISREYLSLLAQGRIYRPQYTSTFPAKLLTTQMDWGEGIYDEHTFNQLEEARTWIKHGKEIMEREILQRYLKKGYRMLFHGPPGTGKTMTASIMGKDAELDVYQVDLSAVVSKYIGETEKNLAGVFNLAENKKWILFFDEADALFGKRTQVQNSNDQFINQQMGYLLQRIEDFDGIIILATNFKDNIDSAFLRRFQSVVYFPKPKLDQRLKLWEKYFNDVFDMSSIDLGSIAKEYEITGGGIINVLRYCTIAARQRGGDTIELEDIQKGINKEFQKEGMTI
ncbi:MAG: ATP-binding protein [Bacteroidota bacterium]